MKPPSKKPRLPSSLSYPLGWQAICDALAGAPDIEELSVSFFNGHWPASEFQRVLRENLPYRLLVAAYSPPPRPNFVQKGEFDRTQGVRWIHVFPVKRALRAAAGKLLLEEGLPKVAIWLRSSLNVGWKTRQHFLELVFHPADLTLTVKRTDGA